VIAARDQLDQHTAGCPLCLLWGTLVCTCRKVEQVVEEVGAIRRTLDKYGTREQRRIAEVRAAGALVFAVYVFVNLRVCVCGLATEVHVE